MSDLNVIVAPSTSLDKTKDVATSSQKVNGKEVEGALRTNPESRPNKPTQQSIHAKLTDLNYSIDHNDNALHLKVQSSDGELVREVIFDRIDPNLLDLKKLKGIFIDGKI